MAVIGIDLGATKLAGAIFNEDGITPDRNNYFLEGKTGKDAGRLVVSLIEDLLSVSSEKKIQVTGIGVGVPGIADPVSGIVWAPNIPGWEDYPLLSEIKEHIGTTFKVVVTSDRNCFILGESWKGACAGCENAIFLTVGTGIGAGIKIDGRVLNGYKNIAGAIGWMALDRPFEKKYEGTGCFEYHASGEGLVKVARELIHNDKNYKGELTGFFTTRDIFHAYDKNDPVAREVIRLAIEYWGMAAANLVSLFNPEKIIFGGGVFGPAVRFINDIYAEAGKWAQPVSIKQAKFEPGILGADAGLYGAGYLALEQNILNPAG